MKSWSMVLGLLVLCGHVHAQPMTWQPAAGHTQEPIWPGTPPDALPMPESEYARTNAKSLIGGKTVVAIGNVSQLTMTVYAPKGKNIDAAVVVFPGGGFQILAMDFEGTEIWDWLTSNGITCVLLKYRVPSTPYDWHCNCRPHNLEVPLPSLKDAQRTIGLVRLHAT
ncbi:MAG: alpha/beta hydrolase, partial [Xanthomonadaceae bacterium]|nr:alpha/beta hydrolase [Xanthomonadaceae bacterium]